MDLAGYNVFWNEAQPAMTAKLETLSALLRESTSLNVSKAYEAGDEEFRMVVDLTDSRGVTVLSIEFTLGDSDVRDSSTSDGEAGVSVSMSLTGFGALVLGGYYPFNYSDEAFTSDVSEMLSRIEALDCAETARYIVDEALQNKALNRELEAA
ncbi:hypothetical protein F6X40_35695 [Paraburkholderia sp. UCT31]|uniref:hypothetical protein n=1 Tax=Paraburkholderia sp. UCT31 TaxID=2615209 RepID=UPI001655BDD1|nr:hypothetical protein [Paraburkholderia sp. UCT31]MBC8741895.1 hypothetical protein [Paraburkholderia sp. UCT31]